MALRALTIALFVVLGFGCTSDPDYTVKPNTGAVRGDIVKITGTFKPTMGVKVYFGKKEAKHPIITESYIQVESPGGDHNEVVDVVLEFDDSRKVTIPRAYKYVMDGVGFTAPPPQPTKSAPATP
jgi:hypothetical protein